MLHKENIQDTQMLTKLIEEAKRYGRINKAIFDKGYDSKANYSYLKKKRIKGAIKPKKTRSLKRC